MILKHFEICLIVIINSGFADIYLYEFFHVGVGSSALKLLILITCCMYVYIDMCALANINRSVLRWNNLYVYKMIFTFVT